MLDANESPLVETEQQWSDDVFGRKEYADFLTKMLIAKEKPFVLNINAAWGTGKTFFLEHWRDDLKEKHPTVMFNAWESDFLNDPLLSVLSCIQKDLNPLIKKTETAKKQFQQVLGKTGSFLKGVAPIAAKGISKKVFGVDAEDIVQLWDADDEKSMSEFSGKATEEFLKFFQSSEKSIEDFKIELSALVGQVRSDNNLSTPLFIFIDELDRCRPTFAIETLERIKHLFDVPEVVFIIGTDTEQLSHSVKAIYGQDFESRIYLRRFFDQEYALPDPDYIKFAMMLFQDFESEVKFFRYVINLIKVNGLTVESDSDYHIKQYETITLFTLFSDAFDLDLRTQKQCFDKFEAILASVKQDEEVHFAYIIFLIMLEAKCPNQFKEYFTIKIDRSRKDLIGKFDDSSFNIVCFNTEFSALSLVNMYSELSLKSDKDLNSISPDSKTAYGALRNEIVSSIVRSDGILSKYKEKVELVGALS